MSQPITSGRQGLPSDLQIAAAARSSGLSGYVAAGDIGHMECIADFARAIRAIELSEEQSQRSRFEAYIVGTLKIPATRDEFGSYVEADARTSWHVWKAALKLTDQAADEVPDGVWEALQRMIEDGMIRGEGSRDDARTVARHRDRFRFMRLVGRDLAAEPSDAGVASDEGRRP